MNREELERIGNRMIELIVDKIIRDGVAEMKAVDKDSLTAGATTEESSAVRDEVQK